MAQPNQPNTALRIIVLVVMVIAGAGFTWSVFRNSGRQQTPPAGTSTPATVPGSTPPASQGSSAPVEAAGDATGKAVQAPGSTPPAPAPAPGGYHATVFAGDPLASNFTSLGSLDPKVAAGLLEFSAVGAGVKAFQLSDHFVDLKRTTHYQIQAEHSVPRTMLPDGTTSSGVLTPMAALAVQINGLTVTLAASPSGPTWRQVSASTPGVFEAFVQDAGGVKVLRIERRYVVGTTHDVRINQTITNLSAAPVQVVWYQTGPVDLPADQGATGDRRRMPAGYLLPPESDPARKVVMAADYETRLRVTELGSQIPGRGYPLEAQVWPDLNATTKRLELTWGAMANRYFGAAFHPAYDPAAPAPTKALQWVASVKRVLVNPVADDLTLTDPVMAYRLDSHPMTLAAGSTADVSLGMWLGPLSRPLIKEDPVAESLGLGGMVVYNMGGPCAFCTFDYITFVLRGVMLFLHDHVFQDWSLAIIFLVVFVRSCLHPLTRWSQIRMQRFGKQMSLMQPKQKKIQEKFKDDPKKMQAEMAALWREEGVSPFGMLGCLPMLLVTPVWLSLYAMLYYAVELRNEPAFYGLIQSLTGGSWGFLADMSSPDALVSFGKSFHVPVISSMMGPISSLNVLPLLLGVVFYFHQKYLSPPTTTQLTPEQETQQKMVKIMSVVMFPVFMYNSPAGLALYFTTNSTLAIVENAWIRKHINKHGLLDEAKLKRTPKDPAAKGFMQRMMEAADQKRKAAEAKARKDQLDRGRGRK